ncbi:MAG: hypothetical protein ACJAS4_003343 [Bacteriovoracaceae bacterium]|jgi:hypothetical protein
MKKTKLWAVLCFFISLNIQAGTLTDYNDGLLSIDQVVEQITGSEDIDQVVKDLVLEEKQLVDANITIRNQEGLSQALNKAFMDENDSRQTANWGKRIAGVVIGAAAGIAATVAHIKIVDQSTRGYRGTGKGLMIAYMLAGGALGYGVAELATEDYLSADFSDEIDM